MMFWRGTWDLTLTPVACCNSECCLDEQGLDRAPTKTMFNKCDTENNIHSTNAFLLPNTHCPASKWPLTTFIPPIPQFYIYPYWLNKTYRPKQMISFWKSLRFKQFFTSRTHIHSHTNTGPYTHTRTQDTQFIGLLNVPSPHNIANN